MNKIKTKESKITIDYLLSKPSIFILITSKNNLKYYSNFSKTKELPFNLRLFFNSGDGLRPLHNTESLNTAKNEILPLNDHIILPESNYFVTLDEQKILTENDIVKFLEYKTGKREENTTPLKEIEVEQRKVIDGRVSVIIPTYKRPENLRKALESVVTQDYHDIEVIVVCDNGYGSEFNEETRQIVNSLKDSNSNCNVLFLEHSVNRNGAAARNTGIMNSTGEYICFLDDDDIYLPGRLSKSIEKLKTTKATVGAVYCGYLGFTSSKNDTERYRTGNLTFEILTLDFKKHYLHTNTATYKREAVLAINGFDETYRRHQDLEFNLRFFELYTIETIQEILVQIRPEHTKVDNMPYNADIMALKRKFLNQFSYIIDIYDRDLVEAIYKSHWTEVKRFTTDIDAFVNKMGKDPREGLLYILEDPTNKKFHDLNHKYTLLMKSISHVIKESVSRSPIKKIKAYKKLVRQYQKNYKL